jgi:hypothetical protein
MPPSSPRHRSKKFSTGTGITAYSTDIIGGSTTGSGIIATFATTAIITTARTAIITGIITGGGIATGDSRLIAA